MAKNSKRNIANKDRARIWVFLEPLNVLQYLKKEYIIQNLPFLFFLVFLAGIYIWNTHYTVKTISEINKLEKELKELRWEYMTNHAELMNVSKQSEVAKMVEPIGLKELDKPPYKIIK